MRELIVTDDIKNDSILKKHQLLKLKLNKIERKRNLDIMKVMHELFELQKSCEHPLEFHKKHSYQYDSYTECLLCGKEI